MIRVVSLLLLASCASTASGPYLFPRAKQRHDIKAYGSNGKLNAQSINFLIIDENEARITTLTPASLTAMKAIIYKDRKSEILYLNPIIEEQRSIIETLLKKLSQLLWLRDSRLPSEIRILNTNPDGTVRELEWSIAKQKVIIKVETL